MKKKMLSFVLALVLLVSTLPFGSPSLSAQAASSYTPVVTAGSYAGLKNVGSGRYLNVYCNRSSNNTNITLWDWDNTSGVKFAFKGCGDGVVLVPHCAQSKVVNVYGDYPKSGSNVCLWSKTSHSSQIWIPEYVPSEKAFILRLSYNRKLVLTADGTKNGANVCVKTYSSSNKKQLWTSSSLKVKENKTSSDVASTLTINPGNYPTGKHEVGCMFDLSATVTSNYNITSVSGEIVNASTGKTVYSRSVSPNAKSFKVACSKIDSALKFDKLSKGNYYIKYTAKDSKTTKSWKSGSFQVTDTSVVTDMIWPLENGKGTVSSDAGYQRGSIKHQGADIAAPANTKILAISSGTVKQVGFDKRGRGYYIAIQHGQYTVVYQHMIKASTLTVGKQVKQGDVIGYVGSTGDSTGNHLHFEIALTSSLKKYGDYVNYIYNNVNYYHLNPTYYTVKRGSKTGSHYRLILKQVK